MIRMAFMKDLQKKDTIILKKSEINTLGVLD